MAWLWGAPTLAYVYFTAHALKTCSVQYLALAPYFRALRGFDALLAMGRPQEEFLSMVNEPMEGGLDAQMLAQMGGFGDDEEMGEGECAPRICFQMLGLQFSSSVAFKT